MSSDIPAKDRKQYRCSHFKFGKFLTDGLQHCRKIPTKFVMNRPYCTVHARQKIKKIEGKQ